MSGDAVIQVSDRTGTAIQAAIDAVAAAGGGVVRLGPGVHEVERTLRLRNGTTLEGTGREDTVLALAPGASCHILTNHGGDGRGRAIGLRHLGLLGRASEQPTPEGHERYPFSCGALLSDAEDVEVTDVVARDIRSTAFHFERCARVRVVDVATHGVGWSGVSTTCTDDIEIGGLVATDSGRDTMHSSIHLDGGTGALVEASIEGATGTGVMLEALSGTLQQVDVRATVTGCRFGLSATSAGDWSLRHVVATGTFAGNREAGVRIANSDSVTVAGAEITGNGTHGVLLQGARGARRCVVAACTIEGNPIAVEERDASAGNLVVGNSHQRPPGHAEELAIAARRLAARARRVARAVARRAGVG